MKTRKGRETEWYLGFTRDGCHLADLLLLQGVDDGALSDVRVANQTNADLLLITVQLSELTQQLNQGSLAERVGDAGVESQGWVLLREDLDPASLTTKNK